MMEETNLFYQQIKEEQNRSKQSKEQWHQLNLSEKTIKKLRASGHSLHTFEKFQSQNAEILKQYNILYILPNGKDSHSYYNRCLSGKMIYSLNGYEYCLLNREEYLAAIESDVSKGMFHNFF